MELGLSNAAVKHSILFLVKYCRLAGKTHPQIFSQNQLIQCSFSDCRSLSSQTKSHIFTTQACLCNAECCPKQGLSLVHPILNFKITQILLRKMKFHHWMQFYISDVSEAILLCVKKIAMDVHCLLNAGHC